MSLQGQGKQLSVQGLEMTIGPARVLDGARLEVAPGEIVGVVGESGSGKSMLCRTLVGTTQRLGARIVGGSVRWGEAELVGLPESGWRRIRGREIGFVPQSSLAGLNPTLSVRRQLLMLLDVARPELGRREAQLVAHRLLDDVRINEPARVLRLRAAELSGGMRQRVMIAAALVHQPALLIADEPTTALDVTVQSQILDLLRDAASNRGMGVVLVSHDLAIVASLCSQVYVMQNALTVESGPTEHVLRCPSHPYTRSLLDQSRAVDRERR